MQFLTFKLSFNDYYIKDISQKIKSVKKRKMLKGEYQSGIAVYGYQKDLKIKNHLVPDKKTAIIVQEIFDMYANKEMSTVKIANELNKRNIPPPSVYMNMPCSKRASKNPYGKYIWLRTQIGSILKNQTYLGHVVSSKKEQISPKIKKGVQKNKSEYIIVQNMHEPIITEEIWNKAQNRINSYHKDNRKKYEYILKNLVYCGECGSKVVFQHNKVKNEYGKIIWEGNLAICKKRKQYKNLCNSRAINERVLLEIIRNKLKEEIEHIKYTKKELEEIYHKTQETKIKKVDIEIKKLNIKQDILKKEIERIYLKKINKEIDIDEFKEVYGKINKESKKREEKINKLLEEKKNLDEKNTINIDNITEILKIENLDSNILNKFINKVEFDKDRNITIQFKFMKV